MSPDGEQRPPGSPENEPEYKVYRSRKGLFSRLKGADLSGLRTGVGGVQDAQFLGRAEGSPRGFWQHFRVWWARYRLLGNDD